MTFEKEFVVGRPREDVVADLNDDLTFAAFFPDTRVTRKSERVRETSTPFRALGQSRDIRFVFETLPDGNVRFEKSATATCGVHSRARSSSKGGPRDVPAWSCAWTAARVRSFPS